jgi:hypothetical protein
MMIGGFDNLLTIIFDQENHIMQGIFNYRMVGEVCALLVAIFLPLCSYSQMNNVLTGTWGLVQFKNLSTGEITDTAELHNYAREYYNHVRLIFKDSAGSGSVQGHSFCNKVEGMYTLIGNNGIISSALGGTMVFCSYEDKLDDSFKLLSSYKRLNDTLYLFYSHDSEEMVFVKRK